MTKTINNDEGEKPPDIAELYLKQRTKKHSQGRKAPRYSTAVLKTMHQTIPKLEAVLKTTH